MLLIRNRVVLSSAMGRGLGCPSCHVSTFQINNMGFRKCRLSPLDGQRLFEQGIVVSGWALVVDVGDATEGPLGQHGGVA